MVEAIESAHPAPVPRGPQRALVWRLHPCARNPIVAVWTPRPVARSPEVVRVRRRRLVVIRQRRWRFARLLIGQVAHVRILGLRISRITGVRVVSSLRSLAHNRRPLRLRVVLPLRLVCGLVALRQRLRGRRGAIGLRHVRIRRIARALSPALVAPCRAPHQGYPEANPKQRPQSRYWSPLTFPVLIAHTSYFFRCRACFSSMLHLPSPIQLRPAQPMQLNELDAELSHKNIRKRGNSSSVSGFTRAICRRMSLDKASTTARNVSLRDSPRSRRSVR